MIKGQNIICISNSDWDKPWGSKQEIMQRLSRKNRILFVEYQASFLHPIRYPFLWKKYKRWMEGVRKINNRLYIYSPFPSLPFGTYFSVINNINQFFFGMIVNKISKKLKFYNPILWFYTPISVNLAGKLKEKLVVYHCIDNISLEKKVNIRQKTLKKYEETLARKCDLLIASSSILKKKFDKLNSNTHIIPSAVDDNFFLKIPDYNSKEPKDFKYIKHPRIGLIGTIDKRIDFSVIKYISLHHPEWEIIIIGPLILKKNSAIRQLFKQKNIHYLGPKAKEERMKYINSLDVCLIPYELNEFTKAISPIKFFEYLALGKPVVSSRLPDISIYEDIVRLADSKEDFAKEIYSALKEKDKKMIDMRINFAKKNSWNNRLKTISYLMEHCLAQKRINA